MIYKEFGKTGIKVSALGMGVSRFQPEECASNEGMERCADVIIKAWENGINYFDTAPTYCNWKSEEILGLALKKIKGDVYISSKSSSTQDATADALRRRLDSTLRKLDIPKITFYNMWGILNYDQYLDVIKPGGPYEGALAAKKEGLIEHICFSSHCTSDEIIKILEDDLFDGITIGYNAINFKFRERGLHAAQEKGLGIAIMNPLYGGVIPHNPQKFNFIKNYEDQTLAQAALLFNISQDAISVVLSGMVSEKEIEENTSCVNDKNKFSVSKINSIKEKISAEFNMLCTGCNYCTGCPYGINTSRLMLAYNQYILTDNSTTEFRQYMKDVWRYTEEVSFDCQKCGYCESKCTQHLPIIDRIDKINQFANEFLNNHKLYLEKLFKIDQGKRIGIYASGPYAKRLLDMYQKIVGDLDFELYFFDSNPQKWGKEAALENYLVYPPKDIEALNISRIVIASEVFYQEIYNSLKHLLMKDIEICQAVLK